jgi:hypothetical protein
MDDAISVLAGRDDDDDDDDDVDEGNSMDEGPTL